MHISRSGHLQKVSVVPVATRAAGADSVSAYRPTPLFPPLPRGDERGVAPNDIRGRSRQTGVAFHTGLALALLTGRLVFAQSALYVDVNATGPVHDGTSWCSAYTFLQDALAEAEASGGVVSEIRVADGVYKPDRGANVTPSDREASFQLLNGVTLRGGYATTLVTDDGTAAYLLERAVDARTPERAKKGDRRSNGAAPDGVAAKRR